VRTAALIDVYSVFFRAHHALPPMSTRAGEPTSALYGFCALLIKVLREHAPEALAFALDAPQATFRHLAYPAYKAGRDRTPDALARQFGRLRQLLTAFGVPAWVAPGFEADDVLATVADRMRAAGSDVDVLVVSGDRDLLQLAGDRVRVLFLGARGREPTLYDAAAVERRFGVAAAALPSWMALVGDTSDNLVGVPGVGPRTAARLLCEFGTIDELLRRLPEVAPPKLRSTLEVSAAQVRQNERLARLRADVPLGPGPWATPLDAQAFARVGELIADLEFTSLLERLRVVEGVLLPAR
jgi:DNA polymerase-1